MDNGAGSYRRFLEGDEAAFDEIMRDYFDSLIFFINRYVSDLHTAEDIAIDVFSDLIVHKSRYNFGVSLKTYLFMIGRSRALNYIKHQKKFPVTELAAAEDSAEQSALEDAVLSGETKKAVHNALSRLPEDMRTAVHLTYFEDLSYEEAARVMKKNRKQIDNLLYRAKVLLRTDLGKEGDLL